MIVLRSFGNTYGFASVRLGFALAAGAAKPIQRLPSDPGRSLAPAIGCAALADRAWLAATAPRGWHEIETLILDAVLSQAGPSRRSAGHETVLGLGESASAALIFRRLGRAGIVVRRFVEQPDRLRVGFPGSPDAWKRLSAALLFLSIGRILCYDLYRLDQR